MAFCISRRGVFIFLILGLSFVHCSENDCEAFDDVDDVQYEKCEVTFEAEDLKESINCGQFVPLQKFKDTFDGTAPTVKYSNATSNEKYLIAMVDPDAPSRKEHTCRSWLHWIVGNIQGDDLKEGHVSSGSTFTDYNPPSPPKGFGLHRYYLFVMKQEQDLGSEAVVAKRCGFVIKDYMEKFNLTAVAKNMFRTENS